MTTEEIREAFLRYFESKGHTRVTSSSLIPAGDPTLLFTNAGMVPFKDVFLGTEKRPYSRATTCQKSLRISGKHNDLENVGRTARHHTFFEMLGNFSFGDYFKQDAILFAWEFVTGILKLPKERLWVSIFEDDDEAQKLWQENTDVFEGRVLRRGKEDNFWAMGDTGPCGPCSEIFYYLGNDVAGQNEEDFRKDDGTYIEIWNLVFMQFNRTPAGVLEPLPKPSVDTGMGLERVAGVCQGVGSNYDSDLFRKIITHTEKLSGKSYDGRDYTPKSVEADPQYAVDVAMRVIADHVRAASFLIADGITPSSDGRGYVLRRLIRRACRHGRVLGFKAAFLHEIAGTVVTLMGAVYPELHAQSKLIGQVIKAEEEKFLSTLDAGLGNLEKEVAAVKEKSSRIFPGSAAFLLHDTYGFPLDLTEDIIKAHGLTVDLDGFSAEMEQQRERSRSARASETTLLLQRSVKPLSSKFVGYDYTEYESNVLGIFDETGEIAKASEGTSVAIVTRETPFYAESGGQVGDTGLISSSYGTLDIIDTQKVGNDTIVHLAKVLDGEIPRDAAVRLSIDEARRKKLRVNHSATHLLHQGLREVLGTHVKQAGSRVSDQTLRFDFSHFEQVKPAQLQEIEARVNQLIQENYEVGTQVLQKEEAMRTGAVALFGEKYGDFVRVVQMGPGSREFCGGTHTRRTGDIGTLLVLSESSVSAGMRRIEAVAGVGAGQMLRRERQAMSEISALLHSGEAQLSERIVKLLQRTKELERELERYQQKANAGKGTSLSDQARTLADGTKVVTGVLDQATPKQLREVADELKSKVVSGCIALATVNEGKAVLLTAVTSDLVNRFHAGNLLQEMAKVVGCRSGGRADLAQAGGGDPAKIDQALALFQELVA